MENFSTSGRFLWNAANATGEGRISGKAMTMTQYETPDIPSGQNKRRS
jgi:hypothetical protein